MPVSTQAAPPPAQKRTAAAAVNKVARRTADRAEGLNGLGQLGQAGLIAGKLYADAGALGLHWGNISREVATLAETDETIAKIIDPVLRVGPYTALIGAVLPLVAQIGVNHGRIPAGTMGTVSGRMLESQIQTTLMNAELEAKRAQAQAEAELREMTLAMQDQQREQEMAQM